MKKKKWLIGLLTLSLLLESFYSPVLAGMDSASESNIEYEELETSVETTIETEAAETVSTETAAAEETVVFYQEEPADTSEESQEDLDSIAETEESVIQEESIPEIADIDFYLYWDDVNQSIIMNFSDFAEEDSYQCIVRDENDNIICDQEFVVQGEEQARLVQSIEIFETVDIDEDTRWSVVLQNKEKSLYVEGKLCPSLGKATKLASAPETDESVKISWTGAEGADGYYLYVYAKEKSTEVAVYKTTENAYILDELTAAKAYTVDIVPYMEDEQTGEEWMGTGASRDTMLLLKPVVRVANKNLELVLTWNAIAGAQYYKVFRWDATNSKWIDLGNVTKAQFVDSNLKEKAVCRYKVRAFSAEGRSLLSDTVSGVAYKGAGDASNVRATAGECKVTLSWTAGDNATGYGVYMREGTSGSYKGVASTTKTSCVITDLEPNKDYYFVIRSFRKVNGVTVYANYTTAVKAKPTIIVPGIPTGFTATALEHRASLTWTKAANATGTVIYKMNNDTGKWSRIVVTARQDYIIKNLAADENATFVLRAYRKVYNQVVYGDKSVVKSVVPTEVIPATPTGLQVVDGDTEATLKWTAAKNATGYSVFFYDTETGKKTLIGNTTKTSYTVKNLENSKTYYFVINAYRKIDDFVTRSAYTAKVSATPILSPPVAPESLTVTYTSKGNQLTWPAQDKATSYYVYVYNYDLGKYERAAIVTTNSWLHSGKGATGKFKYMVRTCRVENGKTYLSPTGVSKIVFGAEDIKKVNKEVHTMYYTATVNRGTRLYASSDAETKCGTIEAGTRVTVTYRKWGRSQIKLSNGKSYYIATSALSFTAQHYTSSDYTEEQKEIFINSKGYTSSSNYLIWISVYTQRVNIFKKSGGEWVLFRSCQCATGDIATPTPLGEHKIHAKQRIHKNPHSHYDYLTKFQSDNALHTRIRYYRGGFVDSRLGRPLSLGCVRLPDDDAIFIYNNLPKGTRVVVY